jgi:hypothetical protein
MPRKKATTENPPQARKMAVKRTRKSSSSVKEKLPKTSDEKMGPFVGYEDELGIDEPESNDEDEAATIET